MKRRILVTGGAGFIGSEFVRQASRKKYKVAVVDKLTYAADLERLKEVSKKIKFYKTDICDRRGLERVFKKEKPLLVINFAAETHVDRSIVDSHPFMRTNILGTKNLLELARKYHTLKFIHISTDEVYGDIMCGKFNESSPTKPNSPYAASKAAADLLINAYIRTYHLPAIIIRPSNNYGPWQYPEKLIPLSILRVLEGKKIPIYAKGKNIREWLYVSDCIEGIFRILDKGREGEIYNLGSSQERKNIEVAKKILEVLGRPKENIEFVADRPGHDFRYALDSAKIKKLGWQAKIKFESGIERTLAWYVLNKKWVRKHSGRKLSFNFKQNR